MSTENENNKDVNQNMRESIENEDEVKIEIERSKKESQSEPEAKEISSSNETAEDSSGKIEELENTIAALKDQLLRKVAEFDNYKKRTENEQLNFLKYAGESLIVKVLPIYDDLKRSLDHGDSSNNESLVKGIKLVYDKFSKILKDEGVEKIEAKGQEFNVDLHEALMQREVPGVPPHTVVEEIEPGYKYKDKVIRHAKVIVSQESSEES